MEWTRKKEKEGSLEGKKAQYVALGAAALQLIRSLARVNARNDDGSSLNRDGRDRQKERKAPIACFA